MKNRKKLIIITAAILAVFIILASLQNIKEVDKIEVIFTVSKEDKNAEERNIYYKESFGEEAYRYMLEHPEEAFWYEAIFRSSFGLTAKLVDYYEVDYIGYWVFQGTSLVYGDYGDTKLILESHAKGEGNESYALTNFEIGKEYLLTVYNDSYCDYAPRCPYTLDGDTFIDLDTLENCKWVGGDIIFPDGASRESVIAYISDMAVTKGYNGEVMQ